MKKTLLLLFFISLLVTCKKDNYQCPESNKVFIYECNGDENCIEDIEIIDVNCINWGNDDLMVIKNDSTFQSYYYEYGNIPDCQYYELPKIDFSNRILIVINTTNMGCDFPSYKYKLSIDTLSKKLNVQIDIWEYGGSFTANYPKNHILSIPKFLIDFNIKLEIIQFDCECN